MVYKRVIRKALFRLHGGDAERVHETTLGALSRLSPALRFSTGARNERTVFGVRFQQHLRPCCSHAAARAAPSIVKFSQG